MSLEDLPRCVSCGRVIDDSEESGEYCGDCLNKARCERCGGIADLYSEAVGEYLCLDCYEDLLGLRVND
jgi:predicted RNA-binding Zn-ribbon protein involved in translation (DUF1610 family)